MSDGVAIGQQAVDLNPGVAVSVMTKVGLRARPDHWPGSIVDATTGVFLNMYLYFYLTAVCGLEGWMAGLALALPLALDALVDPLVGSLSDNLQQPASAGRRPFMLAAILPRSGFRLGLLFRSPSACTGWGLFAYVSRSPSARIGMSLFIPPYSALGCRGHDQRLYVARSTLRPAPRFAISTTGNRSSGPARLWPLPWSIKAGGQLHRAAYSPLALAAAPLILVGVRAPQRAWARARRASPPRPPRVGRSHGRWCGSSREVWATGPIVTLPSSLVVFIARRRRSRPRPPRLYFLLAAETRARSC